ncbi:MAG: transporter [Ramlibacter sp.]|nr:transporter [Ramlibacter sp.]
MTVNASSLSASNWSPLRHRVFAVLWAATVVGNVGTFMSGVASAWLVLELSATPFALGLIQAASTLPVLLLAIPAGVLADILDRRRMLIGIQFFLAAVSAILVYLASRHALTVPLLVALTFLDGIGAAMMGPPWQAIVPDLVDRSELRAAVALNSLGFNVARAAGPALGGVVLAVAGPALTYAGDLVTYPLVLAALLWWRAPRQSADPLREHFWGGLRAGIRFAIASPQIRAVLGRCSLFFTLASVAWALLPLVARKLLGGGPGFYGLMLGAAGAGAIAGAVILPLLRARLSVERVVLVASAGLAIVLAALGTAPPKWLALILMLLVGICWIAVLTTLNATTQAVLAPWVRGRGLAIYLTVFNAAMTVGSLAWGAVAEFTGVASTLWISSGLLLASALLAPGLPLPRGDLDLQPANHWPEPSHLEADESTEGPVMVQVEYCVASAIRVRFLSLIHELGRSRKRDGAYDWGVAADPAHPEIIVEWFRVASWNEHLRQHRRVSAADAALQARVLACHSGSRPPLVRHLISVPLASPSVGAQPDLPGEAKRLAGDQT